MVSSNISKIKGKVIGFLSALFHNILIQLTISLLISASILNYIGILNDVLYYHVQIWQIIAFILGAILAYLLIMWGIFRNKYEVIRYNLLWKFFLVKNKVISLSGPYCPDCDCDVSHTLLESTFDDGATLSCPQCQKEYRINAVTIKQIKSDVKEIIKSNLKSNKILEIKQSFYGIGNGFFEIKNKGIFDITDVGIIISANVGGENKTIGTYSLNNLDASESSKLNDEVTEDLGNILIESGFISIMYEEIPEEHENYFGDEVTVWHPYNFIRLKKDFQLPLFVDLTYSLEKKQKIQRIKFLLTMTLKENWKAYDYDQFTDDCNIKLFHINDK